MLFELFSGEKAFDDKSLDAIIAQITTGEAKNLADKVTQLPETLITLIQNLLVVEPSKRPLMSDQVSTSSTSTIGYKVGISVLRSAVACLEPPVTNAISSLVR